MENRPIDTFLRIALVALLLVWCFLIARPFLVILMWALIISVSLQPLHDRLSKKMKGRKWWASIILIGGFFLMIILPIGSVSSSMVHSAKDIVEKAEGGTLAIPPPSESVKTWPIIGESAYQKWTQLSTDLDKFFRDNVPGFRNFIIKTIGFIGQLLMSLIMTALSLLIAGYMMTRADQAKLTADRVSKLIMGMRGPAFVDIARNTIRSVVKGIVLIGFIQGVLAYLGFVIAGIPFPGIWAAGVILLAIMQLPPVIMMIFPILYMFSENPGAGAVVFTVYCLLIGMVDNFLKPIFLGRGLDVPSLVILVGALGGMILHGIIGLFVGSVVLAVGYQLYSEWVKSADDLKEGIS